MAADERPDLDGPVDETAGIEFDELDPVDDDDVLDVDVTDRDVESTQQVQAFDSHGELIEADDERESYALHTDQLLADDPDDRHDPPDNWSAAEGFGTTAAEEVAGESIDLRLSQEQPDTTR